MFSLFFGHQLLYHGFSFFQLTYLRQDIIWSKPNPSPESVKDRCTKSHEYIFLLTKSSKYFYDSESIKEPVKDKSDNSSLIS